MPNLTFQQIEDYVNCGGQRCPYCKSAKIQAGEMSPPNYDTIYQDVTCLECKETWTDEYKLSGLSMVDMDIMMQSVK